MKILLTCLSLLIIFKSYGQSRADLTFTEQSIGAAIFNYTPVQRAGVTEQRFKYAHQILNDTKTAAKNNPQHLNAADYWNITSAFIILKESGTNINAAFSKAIHTDKATICSYIKAMGTGGLDQLIPETFLPFYADCRQGEVTESSKMNDTHYTDTHKLDSGLVRIMSTIYLNDTRFRKSTPVDWTRQKPLDEKNQQLIDSLFSVYQIYIGRSLVGRKLESVMWLVVQHAPLEMMEAYLPVIAAATAQKQLEEVPLKMLIDRIYWLKYNYQLFGSQGAGVKMADDKTKDEVIKRYKLN